MNASAPWPWWLASLVLGTVPVAFWIAMRRPLGVSGALARFAFLRDEIARDRAEARGPMEEADFEAALLTATAEAFGPHALRAGAPAPVAGLGAPSPDGQDRGWPGPHGVAGRPAAAPGRRAGRALTLRTHALFLAGIAAGGLLARATRGGWHLQGGLGEPFAHVFGTGALAAVALVGGGALVGAGAALAGGCTSGHGLTGCARLQRGSVVAVACFFAAAVAIALALSGWRA